MKKLAYILVMSFFLVQCSKKVSDTVQVEAQEEAQVEVVQETPVEDPNAWRSAVPQPGPARPIKLGNYNSFDMDNGLKVIVVENHKIPRVSYQLSLLHDNILEGDMVGYTSMTGNLMDKGTTNKTKAEIDEALDFVGASLSASSSGIFGSSLKKHQDRLLDVMTDVLYNPSFPEDEFEKAKKRLLSGIASSKTDPNAIAGNVASVINYGKDHPYGEVQTEEHVNNMTLDKCKEYYDTYFKANNAYLVVVGDITLEEAKEVTGKYFSKWESGDVPESNYDIPTGPDATSVAFADKAGAVQSVIRVTYPVKLKTGSPDAIKARVMNSILGGGIFSGRLMQNLREDKAYTYGARSSLSADRMVGTFNAYASVRNEVTDSSVHEFLYELNRMVNEPVSQEDLDLVKNSMAGSFARSLESPQTIARFARNIYRYNLPSDYYETYLSKLEAVTVADIQEMAKKYIRPDRANILVVGNKDEVADKLLKFDSDEKIDYYDPFGNEMKYDDTVIPSDITGESVINDYLEAIGGKDKLMAVKTYKNTSTMSLMGQEATVTVLQKAPNMLSVTTNMQGMTVQEQRFNGEKAMSGGMGQKATFVAGDKEYEMMKEQATIFKQLDYLNGDYKLDLKGIEDVDGTKAYKIIVTKPSGEKETQFYSIESNYIIRNVVVREGPEEGQSMTLVTNLGDYKQVDDISIPHSVKIDGAMPVTLEMNVSEVQLNVPISDAEFSIE